MIFPGEKRILMDVALNRCSAKQLITRRSAHSNQFIGHSLDSLVRQGYLEKNGVNKYQLTLLGARVLLQSLIKNGVCDKRDFLKLLYENEAKYKAALKKLQAIHVEFSGKKDTLYEQLIRVN